METKLPSQHQSARNAAALAIDALQLTNANAAEFYKTGWDACYAFLSEQSPAFDENGVDEAELLRLSTEDNSPGHEFAADFRIGFRYGWRRGDKARWEQDRARIGLAIGREQAANICADIYQDKVKALEEKFARISDLLHESQRRTRELEKKCIDAERTVTYRDQLAVAALDHVKSLQEKLAASEKRLSDASEAIIFYQKNYVRVEGR